MCVSDWYPDGQHKKGAGRSHVKAFGFKLSPMTEETLCSRSVVVWRDALKPQNYDSLCKFRIRKVYI